MKAAAAATAHHHMLYVLSLLLCLPAFFIINTDGRRLDGRARVSKSSEENIASSDESSTNKLINGFDVYYSGPYGVSSPFNLPPYDSLPPVPNTPPFCLNPPSTPQPPNSGSSGEGGGPTENTPPTPSTIFTPPYYQPSPPIMIPGPPLYFPPPTTVPSPTDPIMSPPYYYEPSPPSYVPISPPVSSDIPSPPTAYLPPVVYPPPSAPPPPHIAPPTALWCVAKPSVPDPIIQEAMNYACASGAECDQIQPNGSCFQPNTLFAHASYAFNSYWQRTKVAGGTCEFGGTAMLVTVDPSYDGCQFIYF